MKKLALLTLASAALFAMAGGASAQIFYSGPGYGPHMEMRIDRGDEYGPRHMRRYDDDRRHYRRHASQACPYNYTVQDGVCKPYRGY